MNNNLRIIFFSTPEFSIPALRSLIEANFEVATVVTRPDKPVGRQHSVSPPPVKILAQENNIKVLQPVKIDEEVIEQVSNLKPDLFVIVAYGKILPQKLLDIPKHGSINIHPSLLPKYRGPSPLQATLLSDDQETGVCIMLIDEAMDHGPILQTNKIQLNNNYTYETLGNELFTMGAKHLPKVIENYLSGKLKPQEQDHDKATFCKMVKKEHGQIDWQQPASYIEKMTRAYFPWPGTYGKFNNNDLEFKLLQAKVIKSKTKLNPGSPFLTDDQELAVACGDSSTLLIEELQPAGKKKMTSAEFMRGHSLF